MNNESALFKGNAKLRQAVNWAIDRPQIVRQHGFLGGGRTDQILPPGMPGYKDWSIYPLGGVNSASLAKAKSLAWVAARREGRVLRVQLVVRPARRPGRAVQPEADRPRRRHQAVRPRRPAREGRHPRRAVRHLALGLGRRLSRPVRTSSTCCSTVRASRRRTTSTSRTSTIRRSTSGWPRPRCSRATRACRRTRNLDRDITEERRSACLVHQHERSLLVSESVGLLQRPARPRLLRTWLRSARSRDLTPTDSVIEGRHRRPSILTWGNHMVRTWGNPWFPANPLLRRSLQHSSACLRPNESAFGDESDGFGHGRLGATAPGGCRCGTSGLGLRYGLADHAASKLFPNTAVVEHKCSDF